MKKVVISCGPIPAQLDSVKFITNRFRGGLAFKTAKSLFNKGYNITVIKWTHTDIPNDFKASEIISVNDVVEYYDWFKDNANNYDAFIMAAAVANLMPSNPYEGKFPSHNYSVGEKFNIEFEIAPRAIDIIKQVNPRCCLIGYKLFDAKTDEELIEIARHTLNDSKANIIFANTPATAKNRKIAVMADNTSIGVNFEEHIEYIIRAIEAEYFKTTVKSLDSMELSSGDIAKIYNAKRIVEYFEQTFNGFGSVAIRIPDIGIVTTSRGHTHGPVYINKIDFESRQILADGKATLNSPLLWKMLENNPDKDYVVHRHFNDPRAEKNIYLDRVAYKFAGTNEELQAAKACEYRDFLIEGHGYIKTYKFENVNWNKYYEQFPKKYFSTTDMILNLLKPILNNKDADTLEIGSNNNCICKYSLDTNVKTENSITYNDLKTMKFDLILLRNSINYLSEEELTLALKALKPNGLLVANGFTRAPKFKITDNEVALNDGKHIHHYLFIGDQAYYHTFYSRGKEEYIALGFEVVNYSDKAILITHKN